MRMANNVNSWPENCGPLRTNSWICLTHNTIGVLTHDQTLVCTPGKLLHEFYTIPRPFTCESDIHHGYIFMDICSYLTNHRTWMDWMDLGPRCHNKISGPRVTQLPMLFPSSSRNQQQRFPRCSAPTETSLGPQRPTPGIGMLHKCKHGFSLGSTTIYYYNISSIMTCFVNLHTLDIRKDYTELSEYKAPLWLHGSYHPMHNPSGVGSGGTGWKLSTRPASNGPYTMENNMVNHLILGVLIFEHTRISTCHDMFFCSTSKEVHVDAVVAFFSFCYMFVRVSPSHTGSF